MGQSVVHDLVVRNGTIASAGALGVGDLGVRNGKIDQLGGYMRGIREIDATGLLVLPGGVDIHTHVTPPRPVSPDDEQWVDDFDSGSRAAIAGGITTIGNMSFQWPGSTLRQTLARDQARAAGRAMIDYILHPVLTDPTRASLAEIPELAAAGHTSLKIFLSKPEFDLRVDAFMEAIRLAGTHGMLTMFHCEDSSIIRSLSAELLAAGRGDPRNWAESRPDYSESLATERAIALCRATGAPIYIVHLSSLKALEACRRARAEGLPVSVETRPLYLHLTRSAFKQVDGAKYVGSPPLRDQRDVDAMWHGLHDGAIQCVCSDHAPWLLRQKLDERLDVTTARPGVSDLETLMPMLFSEGVRTGRISLGRFIELVSTNAARLFGMYPRKGTLAPGSDADFVLWDPDFKRTIEGVTMQSNADYSVYDGREVWGWPRYTVSRGVVVLDDGDIVESPGVGELVRRQPGSDFRNLTHSW